jgi:hypothetical protein
MNSPPADEDGKSCPLCTYENKVNVMVCLMCETTLEVVVKPERLKINEKSPPTSKPESSPKRETFNLIDLCATSESDYDQNEDNEEEEDDQIEKIEKKQRKREDNGDSGSDENGDEDDVTWSEDGEQSGSDELGEEEEEDESEDDLIDTDDENQPLTPRKLQKHSGRLSDIKNEGKVKKETRVNGDDDIEEYESESDILSFSGFHQKSSSRSCSSEKKPPMKRELTLAFPDVSQHFWYY